MKKRYFVYLLIIIFVMICTYRIIDLSVIKRNGYEKKYDAIVNRIYTSMSAPRGRMLDVNGKVLVDNVGVNTIIYNRGSGIGAKTEIENAKILADIISIDERKITERLLKTFYLATHNNGKDLITKEEYKLKEERKLNSTDIEALKYSRVTEEMLNSLNETERKASYIYYLLRNGYSYQDKVIKKNISDEELAKINSLNLPGIRTVLTWERIYPYGETLRTIFGSVSTNGIPLDLKEHYYDEKGLNLASTVGVSFLEYQYDDVLRGKDAVYRVNNDNSVTLLEPEEQGSDIYLSIDIDTQLKVEEILKSEMKNAKKARNTDFYNHSFVMVGRPKTGEIVAVAGLFINDDHFSDISGSIISSSYTVGSIVKGATMSVGYEQGIIKDGAYVLDACVKVYGVTEKCSWTKLGRINDISAMALSSNYFQFLIAAKLANPAYRYNAKLNVTEDTFNIYRDMLKSYGLGAITGVDLPNERVGIIGKTVSDDLILNLAIGQYDTYTPIEVFQYINTLANNGTKLKPHFVTKIVNKDEVKMVPVEEMGKVNLDEVHMKRVQEGLRQVMVMGTGHNYNTTRVPSAGKTGTSETFVDSNGDGKMDTKTISNAFIMYAPFDDPEYSIAILSPNISRSDTGYSYKYAINLRVNQKIVKYLFEN